jgi:hypothetical protein
MECSHANHQVLGGGVSLSCELPSTQRWGTLSYEPPSTRKYWSPLFDGCRVVVPSPCPRQLANQRKIMNQFHGHCLPMHMGSARSSNQSCSIPRRLASCKTDCVNT